MVDHFDTAVGFVHKVAELYSIKVSYQAVYLYEETRTYVHSLAIKLLINKKKKLNKILQMSTLSGPMKIGQNECEFNLVGADGKQCHKDDIKVRDWFPNLHQNQLNLKVEAYWHVDPLIWLSKYCSV